LAALQAGNIKDAERSLKVVLRTQPRHVAALNLLGIVLTRLGRFAEAETYLRRALEEHPNSDATLYNYGIILKDLNRPTEALQRFTQALAINSAAAETWNMRGTVLSDLKRPDDAIADFEKAIQLSPRYAEAFCNKGNSLAILKRLEEALSAFERALTLKPDLIEAWCGRGNVCCELKRHDEALGAFEKALALKPGLPEAWFGRGSVLFELKRHDEAIADYKKALTLKPDYIDAYNNCGSAFLELENVVEAIAAFDKALGLRPDFAEAWQGIGSAFLQLKQYDKAFADYKKALTLKPDLAEAWFGLGKVCIVLRRWADAFSNLDKAFSLKPDLKYVGAYRLWAKLQICDWTDLEAEVAQLLSMIKERQPSSTPFTLLLMPLSAADQLQNIRRFLQDQRTFQPVWRGEVYSHERIRIAYVSSDFREHAVAYLTTGLFEHHDKSRFEMTAISFGPERDSEMRSRIKASFERFIDVDPQSDQEIADLIRQLEIDIVVDLNGFTQEGRPGVFARRPAPIQVNYLGYSGTMGAEYYDYIIADRTVIPDEHFEFYSEKVVWLPDSYMVNDAARRIAERVPTRSELNLPDTGFVFCCFNQSFKLNPMVFDLWMRLLKEIDGSVLWLKYYNETDSHNLRLEASRRGVAPERLVFAPQVPLVAEHLARHRQADLFLDTLPYNAHTTASDALWAGVPVLTCLGSTFVGRVGASLLKAVGLSELVTTSLEEYEALALKLAHDPALLAALKVKLASHRDSYPLFDTKRFTRNIEAAYTMMWQRYQRGEPPQNIAVGPSSADDG